MIGSKSSGFLIELKPALLASPLALTMSLVCIVLVDDPFWVAAAKAPVFALCLGVAKSARRIWPLPETRSLSWALVRHHLVQGVLLSLMIAVGMWPDLEAATAACMVPLCAILLVAGNVAYELVVPPRPCPQKAETP